MSVIKVRNLKKTYGYLNVFKDFNFSLERGQKVALVGLNGTGKTTLLRILAGLEEADSGVVDMTKGTRIGYLPQDFNLNLVEGDIATYLRETAGQAVPDHEIQAILAGFGLEEVALDRELPSLSSGQKSKVVLAGILLKGADLLLLDEPTNNLDLPALIWLEDFLQKSQAACIVVSHDRRFLDRVAKKIWEIDWHTKELTMVGGTYSDYLDRATKTLARQKEDYRLQQEEIERLTARAREKRNEAGQGNSWQPNDKDKLLRGFKRDRSKSSARTARALDTRIANIERVEKPVEREPFMIALRADTMTGVRDIYLKDLMVGYDDFKLGPITLDILDSQRVGLMGLNGTGKSTLLKTITGTLAPLAGKLDIGAGVRFGNMMQEHESLPREETVVGFLKNKAGLKETEAYNQLVKFGFNPDQAKQPIGELSPGARARLLLAYFSAESVNVLVLDEPTNHLDLEALAALEETLGTYEGTVILVSHDRYFLEQARLDSIYVLADGALARIPDYQNYVADAEERAKKLLKLL
jgi:ATPase subunit of ABC transporter with duplicated ATPase domains